MIKKKKITKKKMKVKSLKNITRKIRKTILIMNQEN